MGALGTAEAGANQGTESTVRRGLARSWPEGPGAAVA